MLRGRRPRLHTVSHRLPYVDARCPAARPPTAHQSGLEAAMFEEVRSRSPSPEGVPRVVHVSKADLTQQSAQLITQSRGRANREGCAWLHGARMQLGCTHHKVRVQLDHLRPRLPHSHLREASRSMRPAKGTARRALAARTTRPCGASLRTRPDEQQDSDIRRALDPGEGCKG